MAGDRLVDRLTYLRVLRYITWAPGLQMSTRVMKPNNYRIEIQNQELSNNVSHLRLLVGQWWVGGTSTNRETRKSLRNPGRRNIDHKDLGVFGGLSLYCPLNYMRSLVYDLSIYLSFRYEVPCGDGRRIRLEHLDASGGEKTGRLQLPIWIFLEKGVSTSFSAHVVCKGSQLP